MSADLCARQALRFVYQEFAKGLFGDAPYG